LQVGGDGVELNCTNLPFGDPGTPNVSPCTQVISGSSDSTEHHFTGKERDTESGLDYFAARHYGPRVGRFMSPDPSGLYFSEPTNPQSLNLYSYVLNNPLMYIDPYGYDCEPGWDDNSNTVTACDTSGDNFGTIEYLKDQVRNDNANTSDQMPSNVCLPLSALYGGQPAQEAFIVSAFAISVAGAKLSNHAFGFGLGGAAGLGAGGIGFAVNASAMLVSTPEGQTSLAISATYPSGGYIKPNLREGMSAFASAGIQSFIGSRSALQSGVQAEVDGSYGNFFGSASKSGVSAGFGGGVGGHITASPGANISKAVPICR
jgi:RHS repeat-associated protein